MPKQSFAAGEHGDIDCTPLKRVGNRWVKHSTSRGADAWRARVYYRGHDGVSGEVSARRKTRKDAEAAAALALEERLAGGALDIKSTTLLVTIGEHWLTDIRRSDSGLAPRTIQSYQGAFYRHVAGAGSSLRGLSVTQANNVYRLKTFLQAVADTAGGGAAKTTKSVLSNILQHAAEANAITVNAARHIKPPKPDVTKGDLRDRKRSLTPQERRYVLDYADKCAANEVASPRSQRKASAVASLLAFMAGTGARVGEARELRWEHVHLEEGVERAYVNLHGHKSGASRRRIDLPEWLAAKLLSRGDELRAGLGRSATFAKSTDELSRAEAVAQIDKYIDAVGITGFVFASPSRLDPEAEWDADNCNGAVRAALDGAGLEWAVGHTFRRTVATMLSEAGVPLARIADQLGHEDPAMTASVYLGRDFAGDKSDLAALL